MRAGPALPALVTKMSCKVSVPQGQINRSMKATLDSQGYKYGCAWGRKLAEEIAIVKCIVVWVYVQRRY